jgi:hypothetical protein
MKDTTRREPLVVVLYTVPLLCEAITSALDGIAQVRAFRAGSRDPVGLLSSVQPDAVVVDDPLEAAEARPWAESQDLPLVHICLRQRTIRVLRNGDWVESPGASTESIRNVVVGSMYARGGVGP